MPRRRFDSAATNLSNNSLTVIPRFRASVTTALSVSVLHEMFRLLVGVLFIVRIIHIIHTAINMILAYLNIVCINTQEKTKCFMKTKRRNISWSQKMDEEAVLLAAERGMDVSTFLSKLVEQETEHASIPPMSLSPGMKKAFEIWLQEYLEKNPQPNTNKKK